MQNSIKLLKSSGILGFIIPLSYVSTARMKSLRKFVEENTGYQYILNYNDRPDCLFSKVHQKLSIIFCKKNKSKQHNLFTSDYKYWYKKERCDLFLNNDVVLNENKFEEFYSKKCIKEKVMLIVIKLYWKVKGKTSIMLHHN
jgi:hypothetical protein